MKMLHELLRRLRHLGSRQQAEADLAEEMRTHLELRAESLARDGTPPGAAEAEARRRFGNVTRLRERSRDSWGWGWLDSLAQDLRYGMRSLLAHRGFTITALLSLALGIGANTAVFGILNAVMLRSLPVENPHRLVGLRLDGNGTLTNPLWEQIRDRQNAFVGTLAYARENFDLAEAGERQPVQGIWVSGTFFDVLGVGAHLGRMLTPEDDLAGGGKSGAVAVLSHAFWQSHFGGNPRVVGQTIRLNRAVFEIVGVAAPGFKGMDVDAPFSVAIPIGCDPNLRPERSFLRERSAWWLQVVGRLRENLTPEQSVGRLAAVTPEILQNALPPWDAPSQKDFLAGKFTLQQAATGFSNMGREQKTALFAGMTVVALVLLIACANIANLLLARATARRQEISIRLALGAARSRVLRQLLTESLLLSLIGLPGGLLLARWGGQILLGLMSDSRRPLQLDLGMDLRVLGFTAAVALITGLLFGLAPAIRATGVSTNEVLKQGARGSISGSSRFHLGKALVAGQVGLSLALLVAAGLFLSTMRNLLSVPLGFNPDNVLVASMDTLGRVPKERRTALFQQMVERVRVVPGVVAVGASTVVPINGQAWNGNLYPDGASPRHGDSSKLAWFNRVSPGYFATMRTPLIMGRDFEAKDRLGSARVLIIGEKTARELFPNESPIGRHLTMDSGPNSNFSHEIVGVVQDAKYLQVGEETRRTAFVPLAQDTDPGPSVSLMVRGGSSLDALIPAVRAALLEVDPELSVEFRNLRLQIRETLGTQRLVAVLSAFFGAIALFLAIIGLYGVTSYAVAQRRGEIGLRMALGAEWGAVIWLVLRDVALILVLGGAAGILLSLGAGRYLASILYGLKPADPAILLAAAAVLALAGLSAGLFPALRATRIDPAVALRDE